MKIWRNAAADPVRATRIRGELGVPLPIAEVLSGLGLAEPDDCRRFLDPRLADLADPDGLPGMAAAVGRIGRALAAGETIAVYGDYDVDGITSAGLLTKVLEALGANRVVPCLPNRREGYGLTPGALARCIQAVQPQLLVTVDCGTNSVEAARLAAEAGLAVIVADHHESSGDLPSVCALVNPKLGGPSPLKVLAGVGVVFKLCHALVKDARRRGRAGADRIDLRDYLDWVAVGTVADIVPLREENRILVRHGLARLNRSAAAGWRALIEVAGLREGVTAQHIAYGLGPRLNSAGRVGAAERALELLLTGDPQRAGELARELDGANRERQSLEAEMLAEAQAELDAAYDPAVQFGLVAGRSGWHPGVIGIVAARLVKRYQRPVAVIAFGADGLGRGSCRSVEGYHLLQGLERCRPHLMAFGGHEMAAGFDIEQRRLEAFRADFNAAAARELRGRDLRPVQPVHAWLELAEVDNRLLAAQEQLEPFGQGNPPPVFAARGVRLARPPRVVGHNHLQLVLEAGAARRAAIGFGMGERVIPEGALDVAFRVRRDAYNGGDVPQLQVQDFRPTE